jgi:hypothetical protein
MGISPEPTRFFHGTTGYPSEAVVVLWRSRPEEAEQWQMVHPLGYLDRTFGEIVVPAVPAIFRTDLTSVPQLMTWLVPKTGEHLPAALIHDGLTPPSGSEYIGDPTITQIDADRIFRDAMADTSTPFLRRWLVWSAVSMRTAWLTNKIASLAGFLGLVVIGTLGFFATMDLFDRGDWLPWMGDRSWMIELLAGIGGAIVVPLLFAVLWLPRLRTAGVIAGIALACLLHVTLAVAGVTAFYQLAEWCAARLADGRRRPFPLLAAIVIVVLAVIVRVTWFMWRRYAPA